MPATYTYVNDSGTVRADRSYPMGKMPRRIVVDGVSCGLDYSKLGVAMRCKGADPPQHSLSNGVLPRQIPEAIAMDQRVGAPPIQYDHKGRAVFKDRPEKNKWLTAHKRVDHDAGYSDPCPGDFRGELPVAEE